MRSTFSILFYINRGKIKADGTTAVMCRITIDGRNTAITTGICCKPEDWNARTGTIRTVRENARLQEYRKYIEQTYEEILRTQGVISAEIIKNRVTRQFVVPTHLLRMGEIERERLRIRSREINSTSTYRQSQYFQKYLTDYLVSLGKKDIAFEEITEDFGRNYKAFLIRNKNFSTTQTNRCLCWLNRLLYLAVDNEILRTNPVENVEYEKKIAPKHKYVTREEMKRILAMPLNEGRAELGRRAFIFSYFTGLAFADVSTLRPEHLEQDNNGDWWIRKGRVKLERRRKSSSIANVPLLPVPLAILKKYESHPICLKQGTCLPVVCNQKANSYLKEIADFCGIKKNLTTHSYRHTFATTVTLANNVPLQEVSAMLGHASTRMTQHYARVMDRNLKDNMNIVRSKMGL